MSYLWDFTPTFGLDRESGWAGFKSSLENKAAFLEDQHAYSFWALHRVAGAKFGVPVGAPDSTETHSHRSGESQCVVPFPLLSHFSLEMGFLSSSIC